MFVLYVSLEKDTNRHTRVAFKGKGGKNTDEKERVRKRDINYRRHFSNMSKWQYPYDLHTDELATPALLSE